jgi:hypothetical protein
MSSLHVRYDDGLDLRSKPMTTATLTLMDFRHGTVEEIDETTPPLGLRDVGDVGETPLVEAVAGIEFASIASPLRRAGD